MPTIPPSERYTGASHPCVTISGRANTGTGAGIRTRTGKSSGRGRRPNAVGTTAASILTLALVLLAPYSNLVAAQTDYGACPSLNAFALDCLGLDDSVTDDAALFEGVCDRMSSSGHEFTTAACVDQAEYVVFYLEQQDLAACRPSMSDALYYDLERFKYQCAPAFPGPCALLGAFNAQCLAQLDDDFTSEQLCLVGFDPSGAGVAASCADEAAHLFGLDQEFLAGCTAALGGDYLTVQRFKYECAAYVPDECQWLEEFAAECLGDTAAWNQDAADAYCASYHWGAGLGNDPDANACAGRATTVVAVPDAFVDQCAPELGPNDRTALAMLREAVGGDCPGSGPRPTPAPSNEAALVVVGGPCGTLSAFEATCMDGATSPLAREQLCLQYVQGDYDSMDAGDQYCYALADIAFTIPEANFASCFAAMGAGAFDAVAALRAECSLYEYPTPAPTHTLAPTTAGGGAADGGPCDFLTEYAHRCVNAHRDEDDFPASVCPLVTADDYGVYAADPVLLQCAVQAVVMMDLGEGNFDYCQTRMPAASYVALDLVRKGCVETPSPTEAPGPGFCCAAGGGEGDTVGAICGGCDDADVLAADSFCGRSFGNCEGGCGMLWCDSAATDDGPPSSEGSGGKNNGDGDGADAAGATAGIAIAVVGVVALALAFGYYRHQKQRHEHQQSASPFSEGHAMMFSRDLAQDHDDAFEVQRKASLDGFGDGPDGVSMNPLGRSDAGGGGVV